MFCPKDDTTRDGDGNDSNENKSCKGKEPHLGDATDSASSVQFSLLLLRPCRVDGVRMVLNYFLLAFFFVHRLQAS